MKKALVTALIVSLSVFCGCSTEKTKEGGDTIIIEKQDNSVTENITIDTSVSSPDEALRLLEEGNARFLKDESQLRNVSDERRDELKEGQVPYAVIISCSDSRVTPTTVFNAGLGELFEIRLAGNVVDDDGLGSIEYAVDHLHTPLIVVMGHESCGAVTATYNKVVKGQNVEGHMESFVEKIEPSVKKDGTIDDAIRANVDMVVKEISQDELIKPLISQGKVKIIGAYYDLDGKVIFNK